jgi:hypothetical protein
MMVSKRRYHFCEGAQQFFSGSDFSVTNLAVVIQANWQLVATRTTFHPCVHALYLTCTGTRVHLTEFCQHYLLSFAASPAQLQLAAQVHHDVFPWFIQLNELRRILAPLSLSRHSEEDICRIRDTSFHPQLLPHLFFFLHFCGSSSNIRARPVIPTRESDNRCHLLQ